MNNDIMIDCQNLSLSYDDRHAVEDVTIQVRRGDYLSVLGENGSGKTTLMKALLALKKPTGGQIVYQDISPNQIGYLPQQTMVQRDFPATVFEVVLSGCLNKCGLRPFYTVSQKKAARSNMEKLGISSIGGKSYRELSGGQQQRVLLARALCATETMLLLDEPVTGLDPVAQSDFYHLLRHLNEKHGITILMITHDINNALQYSNMILQMQTRAVFFGTRDEYFETDLCKHMMGGTKHA